MLDDGNLDLRGNGFRTYTYDDDDDDALEKALDTFEKRAAALEAHATYDRKGKGCRICFISMQMDWDAVMERARRMHARQEKQGREGRTYITAIDARKLAQKKWNLLRMADELEVHNVELEYYVPGGAPWNHRWYQDEVLAIDQIPRDCILGTFILEEKEDWQTGATTWRDTRLIPELQRRLGFSEIFKAFSPELFKTS